MSVTLWAALFTEAVSVALLRCRLGKLWLRRPAVILVLASVACQGLPAVLLSFPSVAAWDRDRTGIAPGYVDDAVLVMSAAILAFTIGYVLTRPGPEKPPASPGVLAVLDWRWLAAACVPLAVLTFEGRGYNDAVATGAGTPLGTVLATSFFVILVAVTAFAIVMRHGHFLPVLIGQSLVLAAAGERTPVLADAIALILLLARAGKRPSVKQVHAAAAMTLIAVLAVTGLRAAQGRQVFYQNSGLAARLSALGSGLTALANPAAPGTTPGLAAQLAVRIDGDAFGGAVLQAQAMGQPRQPASYVAKSLLLPVPSALWPSKLGQGTALNPVLLEMNNFGLQRINFLPGLPGLYMGFLSWPWLCVLFAALGVLWGRGERWLMRDCTAARQIMLAGTVIAIMDYQAGLPGMLVLLRSAAILALAVRLAELVLLRRALRPAVSRAAAG
jgi:hypothetical protein